MSQDVYLVSSAYGFSLFSNKKIEKIKKEIFILAKSLQIFGLFIIAKEGFNMSFSGKLKNIQSFKDKLSPLLGVKNIFYKDNFSNFSPFFKIKIKTRDEIMTSNQKTKATSVPSLAHSLNPKEWNDRLKNKEDKTFLLDIRNEYEVNIGKFKGAISLNLREFNEFPEALKKHLKKQSSKSLSQDSSLIYCTGGIRCEKAIPLMKELGFKEVYQLKGGILNYLSKYPKDQFEGECFVFDHRVAVNQNLEPSKIYSICPHCGDPGKKNISCIQCKRESILCDPCYSKGEFLRTCSKNCTHHFKMGHRSKRIHKDGFFSKKWKQ